MLNEQRITQGLIPCRGYSRTRTRTALRSYSRASPGRCNTVPTIRLRLPARFDSIVGFGGRWRDLRVWRFGYRVQGSGCMVQGLRLRVQGFVYSVLRLTFSVQRLAFGVQGLAFSVQRSAFYIWR